MTFTAVKNSSAFDSNKLRLEEEDLSWLETSDYSHASTDLRQLKNNLLKRSEDGWDSKRPNNEGFFGF